MLKALFEMYQHIQSLFFGQRFENEINLWSDLKNEHILPFYGIVTNLGQHIHMVRVTVSFA
jgi:hypothetical protein